MDMKTLNAIGVLLTVSIVSYIIVFLLYKTLLFMATGVIK